MYKLDGNDAIQQKRTRTEPQRTSVDKYERFESWLRENGAQFDLVSYLFVISIYATAVYPRSKFMCLSNETGSVDLTDLKQLLYPIL